MSELGLVLFVAFMKSLIFFQRFEWFCLFVYIMPYTRTHKILAELHVCYF